MSEIIRFGIISDTHGRLHPDVFQRFQKCHSILHAGDVGDPQVLEELKLLSSTYAVAGNVDHTSEQMPQARVVELPFGKVGIAHGHRNSTNQATRARELIEMFAPNEVRLIIHGHSHQQYLEYRSGLWVLNPGAAGRPRFGVMASICILEWTVEQDLLRFDFQPLFWS